MTTVEKTLGALLANFREACAKYDETELAEDMRLWHEDDRIAFRVAKMELDQAIHEINLWKAHTAKGLRAVLDVLSKEEISEEELRKAGIKLMWIADSVM